VPHPYWPVADLRLHTPGLLLRPMTEADLAGLADVQPPDFEQDPALPTFPLGDERAVRGAQLHQAYWRSLGTWRPESWRLNFVVLRAGRIVGVQELEGQEFAVRGTVDSSSWLVAGERGRGVGKAMRLAVLALAFDGLGAAVAETSAWHDNAASLGVSRALGYVANGVHRHPRGDGADDMVALRLDRARWRELHAGHGVTIEGLAGCRAFFGAG
jgi:RimJ/RimL family protein N-acetyltransferase